MGHIHLATLPSTRRWREVVALLDKPAAAGDVVAASAAAAAKDLASAAGQPALAAAVRLLALIPQAARADDFAAELRRIGLEVPEGPMLADITAAASRALDPWRADAGGNDFDEIARRALVGTLSRLVGEALPGLFDADSRDVQAAAARLGRPEEFSRAARTFFGQLLSDSLGYWLDRALSVEIGGAGRFESFSARDDFDCARAQYCSEATRIIREFSAAWYGKTLFRDGTITQERAAAFSAVAIEKIVAELGRKQADRA
jgi:hypothetical protein